MKHLNRKLLTVLLVFASFVFIPATTTFKITADDNTKFTIQELDETIIPASKYLEEQPDGMLVVLDWLPAAERDVVVWRRQ